MSRKGILVFLCIGLCGFAAEDFSKIKSGLEALLKQRKYETAFQFLEGRDPNNENVEIALLKADLALKYFVKSIMHRTFCFKDLGPGETLDVLRESTGNFNGHLFEIDKVLARLIEKHPQDGRLYKALGDFYYDVFLKYPEWEMEKAELAKRIKENYRRSLDDRLADGNVYYALGYLELLENNFDQAIPLLEESLRQNGQNAEGHYNLAYALLQKNDVEGVLKHAGRAGALYQDKSKKADAFRMIGAACAETGRTEEAIKSYETSLQIENNNYYSLKGLIPLYLKAEKYSEALRYSVDLFRLDPKNPTVSQDLLAIYLDVGGNHPDQLAKVFEELSAVFQNRDEELGNIYFHKAVLLQEIHDLKEARKSLEEAKRHFQKALPKDHAVFKEIEKMLERLDKETGIKTAFFTETDYAGGSRKGVSRAGGR